MTAAADEPPAPPPGAARDRAPLVSVIVPAHDAAAYIGDALESLRRQTLPDIEVIVVNDGSTDATESVARSYAAVDPRFHVISRDVASGRPACARNVGLAEARGEYVAFLDADDIAVPARLAVSVDTIRATGASLVFGEFHKFLHDDGSVFPTGHLGGQRFVERAAPYLDPVGGGVFRCRPQFGAFMLTDMAAVNTQTFFARRADVVSAGTFDESLVGGEDLDLFFRMAARFPVAYVDAVQTLMRVHSRSLTATQTDRCMLDAIAVRRGHLDALHGQLSPEERRNARTAIADMLADLGYGRWTRGARAEARAALAESWRTRPSWQTARMFFKAWLPRDPLLRAWARLTGTSA